MSRSLERSDDFWDDLARQVDWYRDEAGSAVALRFVDAVEATLHALLEQPRMGRLRFRDWPELKGIRSFRVRRPFNRFLIFYRTTDDELLAERLIYGGRDLPRRLMERRVS